jgi:hypothetical protein
MGVFITLCQPDLHNNCFAYNTVLTSSNIAAHSKNPYNIQYPHPNFKTPRSMKISSYTVQIPHLSVLPSTILAEHYSVFSVQVKQTTYTIRSFLNPAITQLLLAVLWLELNDCTYIQHSIHSYSEITLLLSMKECFLNYEQKNIIRNTR